MANSHQTKIYAWLAGGILLVVALTMGLAAILPERQRVYDFIMLYSASLGIIHRVPLYDNPAITNLAIAKLNLADDFTLFPYPYPPWYALSFFYLAFLPLKQAATAWTLFTIGRSALPIRAMKTAVSIAMPRGSSSAK